MSSSSPAVPTAAGDVLDPRVPVSVSEPHAAEPQAHGPPQTRCPNCDTPAADHYCPHCGQPQTDIHRSLRGIVGDLLDAFAGWDAKIPRTLLLLVRRPGALTAEYLTGRRARYVPPLRLYLTLSIIFFLALRVPAAEIAATLGLPVRPTTPSLVKAGLTPSSTKDSLAMANFLRSTPKPDPRTSPIGQRIKYRMKHGLLTLQGMSPEQSRRTILDGVAAHAGNMVFALLPIFALMLRVLYVRSPFFYAEHFVFALHVHALAMLTFTALQFVPGRWVRPALVLWPMVYVYLAMRRVYGQSRRRTFAKYVLLGTTYSFVVLTSITIVALLGILLLG